MLVLGDKAQYHGLGTSLLKRLHGHYNKISSASGSNPYIGKEVM